jgi:PITH domain
LGFSEAADFAPTQEFELTEQQLGGEPVPLKCACLALLLSDRHTPLGPQTPVCNEIAGDGTSTDAHWRRSCRYVKFQAVNHLSIFIEDNQGDEEVTRVGKIQLLGAAGQTMNVAEIKKVEDGH